MDRPRVFTISLHHLNVMDVPGTRVLRVLVWLAVHGVTKSFICVPIVGMKRIGYVQTVIQNLTILTSWVVNSVVSGLILAANLSQQETNTPATLV